MASVKLAAGPSVGPSNENPAGDISLLEFLDLSQLNCLNEHSDHTFKSIMSTKSKNTSSAYLLSDADEQLLLNIPFNQAVRVRALALRSSDAGQAPKVIKILTNRPSLGFEDVEDAEEPEVAQVIELSADDVAQGNKVSLRFVRFQSVNSLHIFVSSNHGDEDETRIDTLEFFGIPVETTKDLSGLKKQDE